MSNQQQIRAAADREQILREAIKAGGFDLAPCRNCSKPIVCLPEGLPMCVECSDEERKAL